MLCLQEVGAQESCKEVSRMAEECPNEELKEAAAALLQLKLGDGQKVSVAFAVNVFV